MDTTAACERRVPGRTRKRCVLGILAPRDDNQPGFGAVYKIPMLAEGQRTREVAGRVSFVSANYRHTGASRSTSLATCI